MEAAKDRVGRNDRLSQGWSREKEEARDRVGRVKADGEGGSSGGEGKKGGSQKPSGPE